VSVKTPIWSWGLPLNAFSHLLPTGAEINRRKLIAVNTVMRQRYRLYRRKKGGRYYIHDDVTGKQDSLHTTDAKRAKMKLPSFEEYEKKLYHWPRRKVNHRRPAKKKAVLFMALVSYRGYG